MKSAFLIASTSSGCGKTTLSLGLMRALSRRVSGVQPFKCGPDYIDTQYHRAATGRESINLDLFISSETHIESLFNRYSGPCEVSIIEGAMGMFDGFDGMRGSPAYIAKRLDIPVVLLVDAASASFSVAATIYGFTRFCGDVRVAGVIFNRVASANHYAYLKEACKVTGVHCFGYIRKNAQLQTPSRHLGLSLESLREIERFAEAASAEVESTVQIEALLNATRIERRRLETPPSREKSGLRVALARDEAFNFIYPANLERMNAEIVPFSPLRDRVLPDADLIYLPGGYPELFADTLEENEEMRRAIKDFAERGGKILAECGGLLYLSDEIDGKKMCGVFPLKATMKNARLKLGYRRVCIGGWQIAGHEFHYSDIIDPSGLPSVARQYNLRGEEVATPLYRYKNVFAGYTHLYWAETDIFTLWK